ncbi:endonuclease/exonuclease/phosphatase family protein [Antarctobacter sp.]|uniref:endonuclease/exonuclease/phosphatase family protein n=1 Tax=Antarctobacter sp. TaxID=1872577 RepID=UPI002B26E1EE|nr:endonuclease/exonuclease/phosphatase family protein [Antarctobacter sp.]
MKSVAAILCLLALATWAGPIHPAGDSLAVIRVPLLVLAALAVIWTDWPRHLRWPLAGMCLMAVGQVGGLKWQEPAAGDVTIYQKNLWYGNRELDVLAADILAHAPDVVTLQELTVHNRQVLNILRPVYPHQHLCESNAWSVAVLSRHPVVQSSEMCSNGRGFAGVQVALPQGPVWVLSVHLFWPWPYNQRPQAERLEQMVAQLQGPIVMAGDFNMMPWGSDVRRLVRATGVQRAGPLSPTYWLHPLGGPLSIPLPLDQAYAPGGGKVSVRPLLGSDHAGVLAKVRLDAD